MRTRRRESAAGEVARALAEGRLVKTFAYRGATHLMRPEDAGVTLALRAASRMWELPSWRTYYGLEPGDWPAFRETVRDALADGPLTREELGAAVTSRPAYRHLAFAFEEGSVTLLKAIAWHGDLSLGPSRDGRATFARLDHNPRWGGVPPLHEAGPRAVEAYIGAYGPATAAHLDYWLASGLGAGRKRIAAWTAGLGNRLAPVDVGGEPALVLRDDLDELLATRPEPVVRLLPAYDQWVLGPGTADLAVVPVARRTLVTRGANVAISDGVVSGTWTLKGDRLQIAWFPEASPAPTGPLEDETARLGAILGRTLEPAIGAA